MWLVDAAWHTIQYTWYLAGWEWSWMTLAAAVYLLSFTVADRFG